MLRHVLPLDLLDWVKFKHVRSQYLDAIHKIASRVSCSLIHRIHGVEVIDDY